MQKWIGNRPTSAQKALSKYEKLLSRAQHTILSPDEKVLKIIEGECDKRSGRELDGVLILTSKSFVFISKSEHMNFSYSQISDVHVQTDGKDKHEWQLKLRVGRSNRTFDDIKKNDDSQEFIEILEQKIVNPSQEILTTVTHNFDHFLHIERLEDLRSHQVKITSFLMKRDDMGRSKNGERLLREMHQNADLIVEGFYQEKEKLGNFIVVDKSVSLYEYDDRERRAKRIKTWSFNFFSNAAIDHFAIKSEVSTNAGKLILNSSGKKFEEILLKAHIPLKVKKRKWHQKILGFRSGKWWKKSIASIVYLFTLLFILLIVLVETDTDTNEPTTKVADTETQTEDEEKDQAEEQILKEEEAARLAEEQRLKEEEAARLAEEQRLKEEEAARLAEEQRQREEEAARLAEQQRQQEEAARLAQEQQQTNVYYKNCTEARNAGAAPVYRGEPGYAKHLDRDGDGIGCDS